MVFLAFASIPFVLLKLLTTLDLTIFDNLYLKTVFPSGVRGIKRIVI